MANSKASVTKVELTSRCMGEFEVTVRIDKEDLEDFIGFLNLFKNTKREIWEVQKRMGDENG